MGAIVGEFIGANAGLGSIILIGSSNFDMVMVFAAITYLTVLGTMLFAALGALERWTIPWHVSQRGAVEGATETRSGRGP